MSKRVKINFETINKGKYEIIPWEKIHETNKRVKKAMRKAGLLTTKFNKMQETNNSPQNPQSCEAAVICWREISKEMPPEHESVLVRLDSDTYLMGVMDSNNEWGIYWSDGRNAEDPERPVTHWMPIPACT